MRTPEARSLLEEPAATCTPIELARGVHAPRERLGEGGDFLAARADHDRDMIGFQPGRERHLLVEILEIPKAVRQLMDLPGRERAQIHRRRGAVRLPL